MQQPLLILGASVRSAVHSAIRAGFAPIAADLFADVDLAGVCPTTRIANYPDDLASVALDAPASPWIYTGALENYPRLVDRISESRPLWGNTGAVLQAVRDPLKLAEALAADGFDVPKVRCQNDPPPAGDWLVKPVKSAGGHHIKRLAASTRAAAGDRTVSTSGEAAGLVYYQEFIHGVSCSAIFVAARNAAVWLGASQQFCNLAWLAAPEFAYAGSFGPLMLPESAARRLQRIGDCLARRFNLTGLFGVDFIWRDDEVWPLEVNPRYTASVEVIERAAAWSALAYHASACRDGLLPRDVPRLDGTTVFGKAIKYATADLHVTPAAVKFAIARNRDSAWPCYADIPAPQSSIAPGKPVMSLLTSGKSAVELQANLKELWDQFEQRLA